MLTGDVFGSSDPAAPYDNVLDTRNMDLDHVEEDVVQGSEEHELYDEEDEEPYHTDDEDDGNNTSHDSDFEQDSEATGTEYLAPTASAHDFLCFIAQPGRPRFTTVANTAGFMRVVVVTGTADHHSGGEGGGSEIIVHYHYTRFSGARLELDTRQRQVTIRSGTKLHRVRFLVPSSTSMAVDPASTLRLAGAALVAMVTVDAGVLRRGDYTTERVARMLKALPCLARNADEWDRALGYAGGGVMRLPAPVRREDDDDRPAKRRRFTEAAEEEECAICFEAMEKRGLAAWPKCDHVFHGLCLEKLLFRGDQRCPLCRSELAVGVS
ncbi:hypothetical protein QOZ80_9AG0687120 [Eleusine coracana subsp. coracana]|nr:hypothetical protein QOZ80_9AG0687120 [Eleusine coracana subsp. coracana]